MAMAGIQLLADKSEKALEEEIIQQKSFVPLNKFSQPMEIAQWVEFLVSEKQTSMTGQAIDINNGSFMI
jgi:NAD(P)-dependent dehydrogenase (short-subunit alcohol dehydrogenase family)